MSKPSYRKGYRSTYSLTVHIIFVTKYRKQVITKSMLESLQSCYESVLASWDSKLIEFDGESDHIHLLIDYPPHKTLSSLIANLKASSSKRMWKENKQYLQTQYWKQPRVFWTGSYFVASCGGVTVEQLKHYVKNQDTPS